VDAHVGTLRRALAGAGLADRSAIIVTGDHGFEDVHRAVVPNEILRRAGLRGCPGAGEGWRATAHVAGGSAAVFVNPPDDAVTVARAEAALRGQEKSGYRVLTRRELDDLGAMTGAALGLEAAPGFTIVGACGRGIVAGARGGTHGYLPSRPQMATGFIAGGDGVRAGVALDRIRLIDVAPTAARLLGLAAPAVEGRVLTEILR
jgi:hypothetical protein